MCALRQLHLPHVPEGRKARPFLKWAGGKTKLLPDLYARLPERFGRYFEPFLGGGALFFALQPGASSLSDVNLDLVQVYEVVRDQVDALVEELEGYVYERAFYYDMRAEDPCQMTPVKRAARMLYLNRTCFNGLYRVNKKGRFNVPFGRYKAPVICQEDRLREASRALEGHEIRRVDYRQAVASAQAGDLVYFDPPYHPVSSTASFTAYTGARFDESDQRALADLLAELTERGVSCMLSNSDTPFTRELYRDFRVDIVTAPRRISRNARGRGEVRELIVRNY